MGGWGNNCRAAAQLCTHMGCPDVQGPPPGPLQQPSVKDQKAKTSGDRPGSHGRPRVFCSMTSECQVGPWSGGGSIPAAPPPCCGGALRSAALDFHPEPGQTPGNPFMLPTPSQAARNPQIIRGEKYNSKSQQERVLGEEKRKQKEGRKKERHLDEYMEPKPQGVPGVTACGTQPPSVSSPTPGPQGTPLLPGKHSPKSPGLHSP